MRFVVRHCRLFSFALLWLVFVPVAEGKRLYRCQDDRGLWSFQDRPCPQGTERDTVRARNLAPGPQVPRRTREIPTACRVESDAFRFEHEDLLGIEARLAMMRDEGAYQLAIHLKGEWVDPDFEARQIALVPDLSRQGLVVGDGGLANPDWLTDLRVLGFGHSRTQSLLKSAKTALDLHVVIHIQGREEADWSLPIPSGLLEDLRNRALACDKEGA